MPELPEVEITARRLGAALAGAEIESAMAPGMVAVKSISPPLSALAGREIEGVRRVGKMPIVDIAPHGAEEGPEGPLALLVHMMSAGRLQLFDKRASIKDKKSRVLIRVPGDRELRLREFGTKQRAWVRLMPAAELDATEMVATLGPEAWPAPPLPELEAAIDQPRALHPLLRDQRRIAGIGRSWVDEILWEARLSPFKRGADLDSDEVGRLYDALAVLDGAISHYEEVIGEKVPDKLPMPLQVHRRNGEDCPRCGATIEAVHYADYVMCYCPQEQTDGKVLKDRRLSRLLK
ncbi:DNA-formamidopyrimidine glycosylase [Thermoleophilia bacterium SCSIO 60948]|nr:DNA-formamidopyrimidine glycosylase [Thermoleophilia bacterium SCSIO 60948]